MDVKLVVSIDLNWPTYEEDISSTVRDAVLDEVRKEVRKQSAALRDEVARQLSQKQKQMIEKAVKAMGAL